MKLTQLLQAHQQELPISPVHERWLADNPNPEYSPEAKEFLAKQIGKPDRVRTGSFSPSSAGKCLRRRQFEYLGLPRKPFRTSLIQVLHNGTWVHLRWQAAGLTAGWLAEAEVGVEYEDLGMKGTMDGRLPDGRGLEIKSINSNGFRYVMSKGPKREHLHQITSYALASGIKDWVVLYEDKDTNEYKEFLFTPDEVGLDLVWGEYEKLMLAVSQGRLIEMKDECWAKKGNEYLQCPFREICPTMKDWGQACGSCEVPKSKLQVLPTSSSPSE